MSKRVRIIEDSTRLPGPGNWFPGMEIAPYVGRPKNDDHATPMKWSKDEVKQVAKMYLEDVLVEEIASSLLRSEESIRAKLYSLGIRRRK